MKKYFIAGIVLLLLFSFSSDISAQSRKKKVVSKAEKTQMGTFKDRLWYGGTLALNFSGGSYYSTFFMGISPMVGYKLTEKFSVGPRVSLKYVYLKATDFGGNIAKANLWSYAAGIFSRFKIIDIIFAHVEYEYENRELFTTNGGGVVNQTNGEIGTIRESRDNLYIGAGYTSGGEFSYEVLVLYNVMNDDSTLRLPFDYRVGFTYRF